MMNCHRISRLASERFDRELGFFERMKFRLHLMMCHHCRRYARQLVFIRRAVRRVYGDDRRAAPEAPENGPTLPEQTRERIAIRLRDAQQGHH